MVIPKDILEALRTHVDIEIQSGRRQLPLDAQIVKDFLSATPPAVPVEKAVRVEKAVPVEGAVWVEKAVRVEGAVPLAGVSEEASVSARAKAAQSLEEIAAAVCSCQVCPLSKTRTKAVPGIGNAASPEILFIGEAPGADEDLKGEPFVGQAGMLLTKMITAMGFTREEVFIANVIKCRPPGNRTPTQPEMDLCVPYLRRQIELISPKVIVALGTSAYRGLTGDETAAISKLRGIWQRYGDIPLMPTFHPAYLLRYPQAKRAVWDDLKRVLEKLGRGVPTQQK